MYSMRCDEKFCGGGGASMKKKIAENWKKFHNFI
jgi:hypothetical protein